METRMSLADLVREYRRDFAPGLQAELDYYPSLDSLAEVIRRATVGLGDNDLMHSYQHRLNYALLEEQAEAYLGIKNKIRNTNTFGELFDLLRRHRLDGVGRLTCYDAAVRIGSYFRLCAVTYLYTGTIVGYRNLGLRASGDTPTFESQPKPLQSLSPSDLKNFLYLFSKRIKGL